MPTSGVPRFASTERLEEREKLDEKTRRFEGDGTEFLIVPGLKSVESVRIGSTDIPLTEARRYVEDASGRPTDTVNEPMISLDRTPDGRAVLLRSPLSNMGRWQKNQPIFVTGEWEAEEPAPAAQQSTEGATTDASKTSTSAQDSKPKKGQ